jgi:hypothetical protein
VCLCVCVCAGNGQLVSDCTLESPPVERERGVSIRTPPLVEEEAPFRNTQKSRKEQSYGHGLRRDPKRRLTVLARTRGNLPDRLCI